MKFGPNFDETIGLWPTRRYKLRHWPTEFDFMERKRKKHRPSLSSNETESETQQKGLSEATTTTSTPCSSSTEIAACSIKLEDLKLEDMVPPPFKKFMLKHFLKRYELT